MSVFSPELTSATARIMADSASSSRCRRHSAAAPLTPPVPVTVAASEPFSSAVAAGSRPARLGPALLPAMLLTARPSTGATSSLRVVSSAECLIRALAWLERPRASPRRSARRTPGAAPRVDIRMSAFVSGARALHSTHATPRKTFPSTFPPVSPTAHTLMTVRLNASLYRNRGCRPLRRPPRGLTRE